MLQLVSVTLKNEAIVIAKGYPSLRAESPCEESWGKNQMKLTKGLL